MIYLCSYIWYSFLFKIENFKFIVLMICRWLFSSSGAAKGGRGGGKWGHVPLGRNSTLFAVILNVFFKEEFRPNYA